MRPRTMLGDAGAASPGTALRVGGRVSECDGRDVTVTDSTGSLVLPDLLDTADVRPGDAIEVSLDRGPGRPAYSGVRVWPAEQPRPEPADSAGPRSYLRFRRKGALDLFRSIDRLARVTREHLAERHFIETRTPLLWASTQEYGAYELRAHLGGAVEGGWLQQTPTVPAMLCAVGGVDRGFQFGRCFRSEPTEEPHKALEFTQLNIAATFSASEEQQALIEGLIARLADEAGVPLLRPFEVIGYRECLRRYGGDTPDFRYARFPTPVIDGGPFGRPDTPMRALAVEECPAEVASALRALAERHWGEEARVDGIATAREFEPWSGPLHGVWEGGTPRLPLTLVACPDNDRGRAFIAAAARAVYPFVTGGDPDPIAGVWIVRQPFVSDDSGAEGRTHAATNLFGRRIPGDDGREDLVDAYDLVVNGVEVLSGSGNENDADRLLANLASVGFRNPERTFGYLLDALRTGAPPLHNTSIGWERLMGVLHGVPMHEAQIMPKSGRGACAVSGLPLKYGER